MSSKRLLAAWILLLATFASSKWIEIDLNNLPPQYLDRVSILKGALNLHCPGPEQKPAGESITTEVKVKENCVFELGGRVDPDDLDFIFRFPFGCPDFKTEGAFFDFDRRLVTAFYDLIKKPFTIKAYLDGRISHSSVPGQDLRMLNLTGVMANDSSAVFPLKITLPRGCDLEMIQGTPYYFVPDPLADISWFVKVLIAVAVVIVVGIVVGIVLCVVYCGKDKTQKSPSKKTAEESSSVMDSTNGTMTNTKTKTRTKTKTKKVKSKVPKTTQPVQQSTVQTGPPQNSLASLNIDAKPTTAAGNTPVGQTTAAPAIPVKSPPKQFAKAAPAADTNPSPPPPPAAPPSKKEVKPEPEAPKPENVPPPALEKEVKPPPPPPQEKKAKRKPEAPPPPVQAASNDDGMEISLSKGPPEVQRLKSLVRNRMAASEFVYKGKTYFLYTKETPEHPPTRSELAAQIKRHIPHMVKSLKYLKSDPSTPRTLGPEWDKKQQEYRENYLKLGPPRLSDRYTFEVVAVDKMAGYLYNISAVTGTQGRQMDKYLSPDIAHDLSMEEFKFFTAHYDNCTPFWKELMNVRQKFVAEHKDELTEDPKFLLDPKMTMFHVLCWFYEVHGEYIKNFPLRPFHLLRLPLQALMLLLFRPDVDRAMEQKILYIFKISSMSYMNSTYKYCIERAGYPITIISKLWFEFNPKALSKSELRIYGGFITHEKPPVKDWEYI